MVVDGKVVIYSVEGNERFANRRWKSSKDRRTRTAVVMAGILETNNRKNESTQRMRSKGRVREEKRLFSAK